MSIDAFLNNYFRYNPSIHYIILYCSSPDKPLGSICIDENLLIDQPWLASLSQDINLLNSCISSILTKKDGKTHIYKKILDFNNIINNNIYIHMIYSHNNNLIRGTIYSNNKNYKINNYYNNYYNFYNVYYENVSFCKFSF